MLNLPTSGHGDRRLALRSPTHGPFHHGRVTYSAASSTTPSGSSRSFYGSGSSSRTPSPSTAPQDFDLSPLNEPKFAGVGLWVTKFIQDFFTLKIDSHNSGSPPPGGRGVPFAKGARDVNRRFAGLDINGEQLRNLAFSPANSGGTGFR